MSIRAKVLFLFLSFLVFSACNLEKTIEVNIPDPEIQMVVECYLEIGKPYRVVITETRPFTEISSLLELPFLDSALVIISANGVPDTLVESIYVDFINTKIANYGSNTIVPEDYDIVYELEIQAPDGKMAFSNTKLLPVIPIDSLEINFSESEDSSALVLTWFTDPPEKNFYRRVLHLNSIWLPEEQSFAVDDAVFNGDDVVFGSGFDFTFGDTLISTLYHVDEAYHDFLETVEAAIQANENPFAQPSFILSNIEGGIGIFTGLSFDRDSIIVQ